MTADHGNCQSEGEADVAAYIDGLLEVISAYPLSITDAQTHINYPDEVRTSFGFDICDVRASATPSSILGFGPSNVAFYLTSVEKDAIAAAVATDAEWSSQATATTIGSAELYDWGSGPQPREVAWFGHWVSVGSWPYWMPASSLAPARARTWIGYWTLT